MGWETAKTMQDALGRAGDLAGKREPDVTMLHVPPIVMADVTV
jgi:hypothetical protein